MDEELIGRARRHAALGEPVRLQIVEELVRSDRSPSELTAMFGLPGNLLAHHLDVLEQAGLVGRSSSTGDRRRRYVRVDVEAAAALGVGASRPEGRVRFVCTHNAARSQLAAALWRARTGGTADSAGTHPAPEVHRGAVEAARRVGLDLGRATPTSLDPAAPAATTITVCDRAHEELRPDDGWWHWSLPDPVEDGRPEAFDAVVASLERRILALR